MPHEISVSAHPRLPPRQRLAALCPATFPYGKDAGYLDQFESVGLFNENQLVANFSLRGRRATAFGFYTLSYANSDTSGPTYQPMNPYDIGEDYGPASFISRNQAFVGGSIQMPKGFRLSPFMIASTGRPFNITLGQDVYGTGVFSARPSLAPVGAPGSVDDEVRIVLSLPRGRARRSSRPMNSSVPTSFRST